MQKKKTCVTTLRLTAEIGVDMLYEKNNNLFKPDVVNTDVVEKQLTFSSIQKIIILN